MSGILVPEEGDPVTLAPTVKSIEWRPKQAAYEAKRRAHRAIYPNREVVDFKEDVG